MKKQTREEENEDKLRNLIFFDFCFTAFDRYEGKKANDNKEQTKN